MNIGINDDEKNKRIEELIKEELEIIKKIKEKLKKKINKVDFILTKSEIDNMYDLVKVNIEEYFYKNKERFKLINGTEFIVENWKKENFYINTLKIIFKELEIVVKARNKFIFDGDSILFKRNESILISFLIENFRNINGVENDFEIYITRKELEKFIKIYEVKSDFIDKLEKNELLIIDKYNNDNLFILLKNSPYTYENESNLRKFIIQNYNFKINGEINNKIKEEIKSEIEKYNVETEKNEEKIRCINNTASDLKQKVENLETIINNFKIEIITMLGIFAGLFSYLTINFNLMKELLSGSKEIESVFLIVAVFCIGLVPIVVILFLIKFLFLIPNDYSDDTLKKLPFWKKYFSPLVIITVTMILVVAIIFIYLLFWDNYKKYNSNFEKLEQKVDVKIEEVQKLKKEIEYLKLKYENQNREKLIENPNKSNNIIILKR